MLIGIVITFSKNYNAAAVFKSEFLLKQKSLFILQILKVLSSNKVYTLLGTKLVSSI